MLSRGTRKGKNFRENGQALVVAVLGMAILLGMVAMAVDVGLYLHERRQLQNAADAAALAGAAELPSDPTLAVQKASDWAANNGISLEGELEDAHVETMFVTNDTMAVTVRRDVSFLFARVLGIDEGTVRATAKARVGSPIGSAGLKPWAITNDVFQSLEPGQEATLKWGSENVEEGNFLPIRLDGQGANEYRENAKFGSDQMVCVVGQEQPDCPSSIPTETGNMAGPTEEAVDWLLGNTPDGCDEFGEVFGENGLNAVCHPSANPDGATLVAIVPVIDALCNGNCYVNVIRFAMFFIEDIDCGDEVDDDDKEKQGLCTVDARYAKAGLDVGTLMGPFDPEGSITLVRLVE